jgi:hypothetical protein
MDVRWQDRGSPNGIGADAQQADASFISRADQLQLKRTASATLPRHDPVVGIEDMVVAVVMANIQAMRLYERRGAVPFITQLIHRIRLADLAAS